MKSPNCIETVFLRFSKHLTVLFALFLIAFSSYSQTNQLAFPGADGFGKYTTGGRGGRVFIVKNLNDSGPGSLREAAEAKGARIVVFEVSGNINLKSPLKIINSDITIAGQTAPGDGITLQNYPLDMDSRSNIVIRFLRVRLGDKAGESYDAMEAKYCKNVVIDHCTFSWGSDEVASFVGNENISIQWNYIYEGLNQSVHAKGDHGYGGILGGKNTSFHHNLVANNTQRSMRFDHPDVYRSDELLKTTRGVVDFRNNVVYNWRDVGTHGGEAGTFNMVNNYYKPGPATVSNFNFLRAQKETSNGRTVYDYGKFFISGNFLYNNSSLTADNWKGVYVQDGSSQDLTRMRVNLPFASDVYSVTHLATEAYDLIMQFGGASFKRDSQDTRIVTNVKNGSFSFNGSNGSSKGIIDSQNDVGGWPVLKSLLAPKDTDRDGMPDAWELENSLNPTTADNNGYKLSSSYTNIEVYINSLVKHISEFDVTTPPSIPQLESPVNSATGIAINSILKWKSAPNSQTYQLQVSKTQDFGTSITNLENLTSLQNTVQNLELNTQYFWRVRAKNSNGTSSWSGIWNFKTVTSLSIPVTGISISPTKASLEISKTLQLTSTLSPSDASNKTVTLTSSDPTIAGVSSTGLVTGIKSGSVIITAKSQDGNFTATSQITVSTSVTLGISGFTLVNADSDTDFSNISNGTIIDSNQITGLNLNIRANTNPTTVGSVSMKLSGPVSETTNENAIPYSLFGDSGGNYNGKILPEGNYILEAIPYSGPNLAGTRGNLLSITFTIGQKAIAPTAPQLTSPTNNSTGLPTSLKLSWTAVSNAESYAVEVSKNPDFSILVSNIKLLTTNEVSISGLQEDELYYWRVKATNSAGSSLYSTVWSFKTSTLTQILVPGPATLISPTNNSTSLNRPVKFVWKKEPNATSYRIQIATSDLFGSSIVVSQGSISDTTVTISSLNANTQYFWRIRTPDSNSWGASSVVRNFKTGSGSSLRIIETTKHPESTEVVENPGLLVKKDENLTDNIDTKLVSINVFPNPISPTLNIEIPYFANGLTVIKIANLAGQEIYSEYFYDLVGTLQLNMPLDKMSKGTYLLIIRNHKESKVIRLLRN